MWDDLLFLSEISSFARAHKISCSYMLFSSLSWWLTHWQVKLLWLYSIYFYLNYFSLCCFSPSTHIFRLETILYEVYCRFLNMNSIHTKIWTLIYHIVESTHFFEPNSQYYCQSYQFIRNFLLCLDWLFELYTFWLFSSCYSSVFFLKDERICSPTK